MSPGDAPLPPLSAEVPLEETHLLAKPGFVRDSSWVNVSRRGNRAYTFIYDVFHADIYSVLLFYFILCIHCVLPCCGHTKHKVLFLHGVITYKVTNLRRGDANGANKLKSGKFAWQKPPGNTSDPAVKLARVT